MFVAALPARKRTSSDNHWRRKMYKTRFIAAASIILQISTAAAQENSIGQSRSGGSLLAKRACGRCHVVDAIQTQPPPVQMILLAHGKARTGPVSEVSIPTFMEIAKRPEVSKEFLHQFIRSTHWDPFLAPTTVMPPPSITNEEEKEIIAYILTYKHS
jgi:hypothetical protein